MLRASGALGLTLLALCVGAAQADTHRAADTLHFELHEPLDSDEQTMAWRTFQDALETRTSNMSLSWTGDSGIGGSVTPIRTFRVESGTFCRDFREIVVLTDGRVLRTTGTACRLDDGIWQRLGN